MYGIISRSEDVELKIYPTIRSDLSESMKYEKHEFGLSFTITPMDLIILRKRAIVMFRLMFSFVPVILGTHS